MSNRDEKILVVGACGQIGVELTLNLRKMYGEGTVIASDLREEHPLLKGTGPYVSLDIMNKETFHVLVLRYNITQVYLLAAILRIVIHGWFGCLHLSERHFLIHHGLNPAADDN